MAGARALRSSSLAARVRVGRAVRSARQGLVAAIELAPAHHLPGAGLRAAGAMPGGHRDDIAQAGHRDRLVARLRGAVAELAVLVGAPALDGAIHQHRAGVVRRAADRGRRAEPADLDRRVVIAPRAVAELAGAV